MNDGSMGPLIAKRNVARRDVFHVDAVRFEDGEYRSDLRPARPVLLPFFRDPIGKDLFRELRSLIEMSAGKVEHERARHQGHGDDLQVVVVIKKARDPASANGFDPVCPEA